MNKSDSIGRSNVSTTAEVLAQPRFQFSAETLLEALQLGSSEPSMAEWEAIKARKENRLKDCEALWRREERYLGDEEPVYSWEELRPMLDVDYQAGVDVVMAQLKKSQGTRIVHFHDVDSPDGVLGNLMRTWYNLPDDQDVLLYVNDKAKFAYFIRNLNSHMKEKGEWLGFDGLAFMAS